MRSECRDALTEHLGVFSHDFELALHSLLFCRWQRSEPFRQDELVEIFAAFIEFFLFSDYSLLMW